MATTHSDENSLRLLSSNSTVRGHDANIADRIRQFFPESSGIGLGLVTIYVEATNIDPSTFYMRGMDHVYRYLKKIDEEKMEEEKNEKTWKDVPEVRTYSDIRVEWDDTEKMWKSVHIECSKNVDIKCPKECTIV